MTMQSLAIDIEPEQIVCWVIAERQAAPSKYRAIARRAKEVREMPTRKELRLGDAECNDLSEVANAASVQFALVFPNKDWRLTTAVEDEIGPPIPAEGAEGEAEEEIDIAAFYDEFIRSGWGNATVVAEAESPAAKAHMIRLLGDIERDLQGMMLNGSALLTYHNSRRGGAPNEISREEPMPKSPNHTEKTQATATHDDVMDVLGNMDDAKALAILALRPTITDIERASMWLSGDTDVFGPGQPLAGVPDQIVTILTADEEENSLRAR